MEARAKAAIDSILDAGKELNLVVSHGRHGSGFGGL